MDTFNPDGTWDYATRERKFYEEYKRWEVIVLTEFNALSSMYIKHYDVFYNTPHSFDEYVLTPFIQDSKLQHAVNTLDINFIDMYILRLIHVKSGVKSVLDMKIDTEYVPKNDDDSVDDMEAVYESYHKSMCRQLKQCHKTLDTPDRFNRGLMGKCIVPSQVKYCDTRIEFS